jgi:hypothetical protein
MTTGPDGLDRSKEQDMIARLTIAMAALLALGATAYAVCPLCG